MSETKLSLTGCLIYEEAQLIVDMEVLLILLGPHIDSVSAFVCISELVDLCDDKGSLKLMFQSHLSQEYCSQLLASRCTFTVCIINSEPRFYIYV